MHSHLPTLPVSRRFGPFHWQLAAVCLMILGCKLWLISFFSSPLPFLDQWRGEGSEVLRPWLRGELQVGDLLAPFNQHRILLSRLLVVILFTGNASQWDSQVAMVFGSILHAASAYILGLVLVGRLGPASKWPIFAALLVLFGLPFDWQNTLWGFQSQFYFLIFFTLATFWGLGQHAAGTPRWWCGVAAGVAACFSLGSGGLAGVALAAWLGVKWIMPTDAHRQRGHWTSFGVALAIGALGFALYSPAKTESLSAFQSPTLGGFIHGFATHLGWPHSSSPLFALFAYAPMAVLFWLRCRRRSGDTSVDDFLFPLGIWVALQAAALAWSRNHAMASVISRYMDLLALGALVNFCCLLRISTLIRWPRRAAVAICAGWSAIALIGLIPLLLRNFRLDLPSLQQIHRLQAAAVRQFIITGRVEDLGGKPIFGLPPSDLAQLADLLRDPAIQNAMPTGLGIRRVPAPTGPLSTTSRLLIDGWGLCLGGGVMTLLFFTTREWWIRRRSEAVEALTESAGDPVSAV